jgi:hypothetical protein
LLHFGIFCTGESIRINKTSVICILVNPLKAEMLEAMIVELTRLIDK